MSCVIGLLPEEKLGIVILQNTFPTRFEYDLMLRVVDMTLGLPEAEWWSLEKPEPISMTLEKYKPGPEEKPITRAAAQKYVGSYSSDLFGESEVRLEGDRMILRFQGFPSAVLRAKGQNAFIADFGQAVSGMFGLLLGQRAWQEVNFIADAEGVVKEMEAGKFGVFRKAARE